MSNLRQKTIFDQFNLPDLSGGTLSSGLGDMGMGTTFQTPYQSPTYEDNGSMRSSDLQTDFRTPEDIRGIGASNVSKVSDVSTKPLEYGQISLPETMDAINKVFTPATRDYDRLGNLLDNAPNVNDYNPSFMRKLTAGLQGMKDPTVGQRTLNQPYLQDMAEWTAKTAPFQAAATGENARNTNERTLAGNIVTSITAQNRNAANQQIADQKNETTRNRDAAKAESDRIRARAYDYSMRLGKGWDWDLSGPTIKKQNKTTGEIIDTGMETGKLTEEAKWDLINEGKVEAARVQGADAASRQVSAGTGLIKIGDKLYQPTMDPNGNTVLNEVRGGPANASGATRVGTPSTGPKTNTLEDIRARNDAMKQYFDTDPEAKKFMQMGTSGTPEMKPRPKLGAKVGVLGFRETVTQQQVDDYDKVRKHFYPDYVPPVGLAPDNAPPNPASAAPAPAPGGPMSPTKPPALPATGQPAQPVNQPANQGPINQQPQVPANKPAMQNEVQQLTKQLNDPMVNDNAKQAIFDRIQFLNKQIESTPSQAPWFWDQAKNAGNAAVSTAKGAMAIPDPNAVGENVYAKQVMTPEGPKTVAPGKVAVRDLHTGEIRQLSTADAKIAIGSGHYAEVK